LPEPTDNKILTAADAVRMIALWRNAGQTVSFTNGVFDLLHEGHLFSIGQAAGEADRLIIGLNSDASVKRLKGDARPIQNEHTRASVLAALAAVDAVVVFEEDTPEGLIGKLLPDVLVKGGDYTPDQIAGADVVRARGGRVVINPIREGFSTSATITRIRG
jgi:D-beta-D-heptose 7-phosphate kinase/D-beta-D-heptose 1-phosphate adenosyltransferase